jgi:hypothetical protein
MILDRISIRLLKLLHVLRDLCGNAIRRRLSIALLAGCLLGAAPAPAEVTNLTQGGAAYPALQPAIDAATNGDALLVLGTLTLANTNTVQINKANLTLAGINTNESVLVVTNFGGGTALDISGTNVTIRNLQIRLAEFVAGLNPILIAVNANDATIQSNLLWGRFAQQPAGGGIGIKTRGTGGLTNVLIRGNIISSLRQPGQAFGKRNDGGALSSGAIVSNHVSNSRGWTIWGANIAFAGNTFGTGGTNQWGTYLGPGDQVNATDIAIVNSGGQWADTNYYRDIMGLCAANGYGVVEDQRTNAEIRAPILSIVYVDPASAGGTGIAYSPYTSLTQAVNRAAWGGIIRALPGLYTNDLTLAKTLTFELTNSVPPTNFTITAAAPTWYRFDGWIGDTGGCAASRYTLTLRMDRRRIITAAFSPVRITGGILTLW